MSPGCRVPLLADSGPAPLLVAKANAGGENEHAPSARSPSVQVAWRHSDPRDCTSHWRGAVDGSGDAQTVRGFWFELAIAGRDDRCRTRRIVPPVRSFLGRSSTIASPPEILSGKEKILGRITLRTQSPSASPRTHNDRCLEARPHTGRTSTNARRDELWVVDAVRQ
jgi:hypothetical protein